MPSRIKRTIAKDMDMYSWRTKQSQGTLTIDAARVVWRRLKNGETTKAVAADMQVSENVVNYLRHKIYYHGELLSGK